MDENATQRFQNLLRELFQFDCADLDFGIYRIMNNKHQVIERFIAEDLPRAISEEVMHSVLEKKDRAQKSIQAARQKLLEVLGEDALDPEGNLAEQYRDSKVGKEYLAAQKEAEDACSAKKLVSDIYNHLYTFFSRYWQDGDFMSKRRYSKKERYAIPYNGEEVYLYWANHDQYYIKTGKYFTDYTYKAPNGVTVHFKLHKADVEQNNVKGEKRFFLPMLGGIKWDEPSRTLTIPFEIRPLTQEEINFYGQKNQQEAIIAMALADIPICVKNTEALAGLTTEQRRTDKGESISCVKHHICQYTRSNITDFFSHTDLRSFLFHQLDLYIKTKVLKLGEVESAREAFSLHGYSANLINHEI